MVLEDHACCLIGMLTVPKGRTNQVTDSTITADTESNSATAKKSGGLSTMLLPELKKKAASMGIAGASTMRKGATWSLPSRRSNQAVQVRPNAAARVAASGVQTTSLTRTTARHYRSRIS